MKKQRAMNNQVDIQEEPLNNIILEKSYDCDDTFIFSKNKLRDICQRFNQFMLSLSFAELIAYRSPKPWGVAT